MKILLLNFFRKRRIILSFIFVLLISSLYLYAQYAAKDSSKKFFTAKKNHILQKISLERNNTAFLLQKSYNQIAKNSIPAVVSIQVEMQVSNQNNSSSSQEDFLRRFFGYKEVPKNFSQEAFGSGFIISPDGYIISNNHLIKNATKIKVFFKDNTTEYSAKVVGTDPETDIALLKIQEKEEFPFLMMGNSDEAAIGNIVIAIGNPFNLSHTFTTGVISAIGRSGVVQQSKYQNFLQTDVAINRGNSGGPLIDLSGEVIGINSAILDSGSGGNIGISFSIPINMAKSIIDELKEKGKVTRGWMGIQYTELSNDVASALEIEKKGVLVSFVQKDSPAEKAGLLAGDILVSFNNKEIINSSDLLNEIAKASIGRKIPIVYIRNGKKMKSFITLATPKDVTDDTSEIASKYSKEYFGILTHNMTKKLLSKYRVGKPFGVIISKVEKNSRIYHNQIRPGNIIESINRKKVTNVKEFESVMKKLKKGDKVLFKIRSGNSVFYIVIRI